MLSVHSFQQEVSLWSPLPQLQLRLFRVARPETRQPRHSSQRCQLRRKVKHKRQQRQLRRIYRVYNEKWNQEFCLWTGSR